MNTPRRRLWDWIYVGLTLFVGVSAPILFVLAVLGLLPQPLLWLIGWVAVEITLRVMKPPETPPRPARREPSR